MEMTFLVEPAKSTPTSRKAEREKQEARDYTQRELDALFRAMEEGTVTHYALVGWLRAHGMRVG